jgi:hypothetical protein
VNDVGAVDLVQVACEPRMRKGRRGAEEGDAPARDRLCRPRPKHGRHHRHAVGNDAYDGCAEVFRRDTLLRHRDHDEVGQEQAVPVQVAGRHRRILVGRRDEHAAPCCDRRERRAAPVEDRELRLERRRHAGSFGDVGRGDRAGQAAAAATAADRLHADERRRLEVIGRCVPPLP